MGNAIAKKPRVSFVSESVLYQDDEGSFWATSNLHRSFAEHLGEAFSGVDLVLRTVAGPPPKGSAAWKLPDDVEVRPLVAYKGMGQFVFRLPRILARIYSEARRSEQALFLLPAMSSMLMAFLFVMKRKPFAVQLVGDPFNALGAEGMGLAARLARWPLTWGTQLLCRRASAICYVTQRALQSRYPSSVGAAEFAVSDVQLAETDIVPGLPENWADGPTHIVFCGSLQQHYKGLDVLLRAISVLERRGISARLTVLGEGVHRKAYHAQARDLAVNAHFAGIVSRQEVIKTLREAALFVMPSRTEGLPRALIEAMAQGLPAIGTRVGGIPELLDDEALVAVDDPSELANSIERFIKDTDFRRAQAERNLDVARSYAKNRVEPVRRAFVAAIPGATLGHQNEANMVQ